MIALEQVGSLPARWRPVLEKNGIGDARAFAYADAEEVEIWFADDAQPLASGSSELERWPKAYQVRWMQAEARTLAEAEQLSPPKWFVAIHDLSDEGTLPFKDIPSGERVNLFYRSDQQIQRLIELGIIARIGAGVHLLVHETWLPARARKKLAAGAIYSLEAMASDQAEYGGVRRDVASWLAEASPDGVAEPMDPAQIEHWLRKAREQLKAAQTEPTGGSDVSSSSGG